MNAGEGHEIKGDRTGEHGLDMGASEVSAQAPPGELVPHAVREPHGEPAPREQVPGPTVVLVGGRTSATSSERGVR